MVPLKKTLAVLFAILTTIGCGQKKEGKTIILQPDQDDGGLVLPDGFRALVVADSVGPTRHIAVNLNGDIYAKLRISKGSQGNVALRDTDGDGKADMIQRFGDYPNDGSFATDMRIYNGYLYFSSELVVYRQKLDPSNLIPKGQPETIVIDYSPLRWHNAKTLAFDKLGNLYVTFSAPTNTCEDWSTVIGTNYANIKGFDPCPQLNGFSGIWRFDANKPNQAQTEGELYATGLRSIVGMTWNDQTNSLYAVLHGRDYLHSHSPKNFSKWHNAVLPSEEFMKISKGEDYGWPYTYYDHFQKKRMIAPEYGGDGKKSTDKYAMPLMGFPAHWAPNDLLFYNGSQFPGRYKHGAFVAFHGSTNRAPFPQAGYVVAFVPFENGAPKGDWEVFADGFAGRDTLKTMEEARYRPMGLAEGPDGSLYISESKKGKIWRVLFKGDGNNFGETQLQKMHSLKKTKSYIADPPQPK
ncbi:MAG: PQQ-dependent sugar dehydrogenase [Bacteroidetes bacterium]|nr:PQQ-dependent sugar dehydrogenase [Bacteroidota bacterium]